MKWCVALLLVGVCGAQDPVETELTRLRERVAQLEARLEEQRQGQEEVNALLLRAMDATTEKLESFLMAVQAGGLEPAAAGKAEGESEAWGALWIPGLALALALLAWLWNLRSTVPPLAGGTVDGGSVAGVAGELGTPKPEPVPSDPVVVVAPVVEAVPAGGNGKRAEALDVENVGVGELGLENVLPVELEEAREDRLRDAAPCRVQWRLACANVAVGEKLVREVLAREPGVLVEPAPSVEAQGDRLRIGYHVHPGQGVAERTRIAARLTEVLAGVPPATSLRGGPVG